MTAKHSWPQIKRYYPLSTNPQVTNVQPSPRTLKIPEICLHPTAWEIESQHAWSDQRTEKGSSVLKQHIKEVVPSSYAFCWWIPLWFLYCYRKTTKFQKKKNTLILQILIFHIHSGILKNNEKEATFILVVMHLHGINYMIKPPDIYKLSSTFWQNG